MHSKAAAILGGRKCGGRRWNGGSVRLFESPPVEATLRARERDEKSRNASPSPGLGGEEHQAAGSDRPSRSRSLERELAFDRRQPHPLEGRPRVVDMWLAGRPLQNSAARTTSFQFDPANRVASSRAAPGVQRAAPHRRACTASGAGWRPCFPVWHVRSHRSQWRRGSRFEQIELEEGAVKATVCSIRAEGPQCVGLGWCPAPRRRWPTCSRTIMKTTGGAGRRSRARRRSRRRQSRTASPDTGRPAARAAPGAIHKRRRVGFGEK